MKRIALVVALLGASLLVLAGVATAGKSSLLAKTWVYDPGKTGLASATWTPDGLSLQKNAPTSEWLSAGATFKGLPSKSLTQLSFEVKDGTYCGAGAPRINVYTNAGTQFFGCIYGTHTPTTDGWTRVEFSGSEPGAGAFGATISGVDVVQDEEGQTLLRNISVNNIAVDKFPHA
jgi:hypothetical protein